MNIETMKLSELKLLENNVRRHTEVQLKELIRSLDQFGQTRAIVIDEGNNILVGNGLYMAMTKRGDTEATVHRVVGLSDRQKKKLVLADNKIFQLGGDDFAQIESYLADITSEGDFDIAGFDEDSLKNLMRDVDEVAHDLMQYGTNVDIPAPIQVTQPQIQPAQPAQMAQPVVSHTGQASGIDAQPQARSEANTMPQGESFKTAICPECGHVFRV